jgi:hypothetical protein
MESIPGSTINTTFETRLPAKLLVSTAVFGALFSWLFARQGIGFNALCFTLLVYGLAWLNKDIFIKKSFREEPVIYLACIPVVFLSVLMFTSSTDMHILSVLVILFVMFVQYLVLSGVALYSWYRPAFLLDIFFGVINRAIIGIGSFIAGVLNALFKGSKKNRKGAIIGVLVGIALLIVIIPILASADENMAAQIKYFFRDIDVGTILLYAFLFLFGASLTASLIANAKLQNVAGPTIVRQSEGKKPIENVTTAVSLSFISVVYVLFAALQFSYFFEPVETLRSVLGLTSSEYAVRGFGEMMFITCLNFVLMAVSMRFTKKREDEKPQVYIKTLYILLVAFNFVILASSHLRISLYEQSFGFTVSRFLSHSFMLLLVLFNLIMLIRVFTERIKPAKLFAVTALIYFCAVVAINPEHFVTERNIAHFEQEGKIDTAYLFSLSGEALVDACNFVAEHPDTFSEDARQQAEWALENTRYQVETYGWQSLNIADQRAYNKLKTLVG